jgi:dipeptidyl aminopeptidase/acylaminoacyl peptidase
LRWRDRSGAPLGAVGQPAAFGQGFDLSPNDATAAVGIFGGSRTFLWIQDMRGGEPSRFTFLPGKAPVWAPDGRALAYARQEGLSTTDIYRQTITREAPETLLLHGGIGALPLDWSPDGKWILFQQQDSKTAIDLWLLPSDGRGMPVPYLNGPFNEARGVFAPDGHWVAYQSDESGRWQIYVQALPMSGAKYQITTGGGTAPRWRDDGKELFYISANGKLVAVPMTLGPRVAPGAPQELFPGVDSADYAPSKDGRRFLMNMPVEGKGSEDRSLTVVLNWATALKP